MVDFDFTETPILTLTEEHIKLFNEANFMAADYENGKHFLSVADIGSDNPTVKIELSGAVSGEIKTKKKQICTYMLHGYEMDSFKLLNAGDEIRLLWLADSSSDFLSDHGIIQQSLFLLVNRQHKLYGKQKFTLRIGDHISKPDFLMCRGYKLNSLR